MKMKKKKEDNILSETPKRQNSKKVQLKNMLKSMEDRSDPVTTHRVVTDYFDKFREERNIPKTETKQTNITAVDTAVVTDVNIPVDTAVLISHDNLYPQKFNYLDSTHSSSEAKIYSIMYRESLKFKKTELRFGLKEIIQKTGLSDKTIRTSIHSLESKLSIKVIAPSQGIYGRVFKIYTPKEITESRKNANIEIDITTKKIILNINTTAVDTAVITVQPTAVNNTAVSAVNNTAVKKETHYKINIKNYDDSKKTESSPYDNSFDHKKHIVSLYKKHTLNKWKTSDDVFYEKIQKIIPDIIEAGILAGIIRSKTKINSLSYFEGTIEEFKEILPTGYLVYLRKKANEQK